MDFLFNQRTFLNFVASSRLEYQNDSVKAKKQETGIDQY